MKIVGILDLYDLSIFGHKICGLYPHRHCSFSCDIDLRFRIEICAERIKTLVFIIVLTLVINLLMTPGRVIYEFGFIRITEEGLRTGLFMASRLILLVVGTSL